jgi:cytochrome P450
MTDRTSTPPRFTFDRESDAFHDDPYPVYAEMRRSGTGLHRDPRTGTFFTATHAHCLALLRDPRLSSNPAHLDPEIAAAQAAEAAFESPRTTTDNVLLFMDPPDHTRVRRLASMAFTPRAVQRLKADAERLAATLLDDAGVGPGSGPFDVVDVLARPLPLYVICQMFAIPDIDRDQFFRWSDDLAQVLGPVTDPRVAERAMIAFVEFSQYFFALADERRAHLGDDLLSALLEAEEAGDHLSTDELLSLFTLLFIAGHETTGNLIGNGTYALLSRPDQVAALRADPAAIAPAIDELLRFDSPVQLTARIAKEPVTVPGTDVTIPQGHELICFLGGANHDEAEFGPTAEELDVHRDARNHLSFGGGVHYCLGASLARLEGAVAFTELLRRCPDLELVTEHPVRRDHTILRGIEELVVSA